MKMEAKTVSIAVCILVTLFGSNIAKSIDVPLLSPHFDGPLLLNNMGDEKIVVPTVNIEGSNRHKRDSSLSGFNSRPPTRSISMPNLSPSHVSSSTSNVRPLQRYPSMSGVSTWSRSSSSTLTSSPSRYGSQQSLHTLSSSPSQHGITPDFRTYSTMGRTNINSIKNSELPSIHPSDSASQIPKWERFSNNAFTVLRPIESASNIFGGLTAGIGNIFTIIYSSQLKDANILAQKSQEKANNILSEQNMLNLNEMKAKITLYIATLEGEIDKLDRDLESYKKMSATDDYQKNLIMNNILETEERKRLKVLERDEYKKIADKLVKTEQ